MRTSRTISPVGLSFLDAMTCGLGAVILLFMIINAAVRDHSAAVTRDLRAEVDRVETDVLEGQIHLVELRNAIAEKDEERVLTQGLAQRLMESLEKIRAELATFKDQTLARREHINKLQSDLRLLEEQARRLSASLPTEETPGDRIRAHIGDGDRQYLTGLKVGGRRILFLVDASASMLGSTVVDVVRRRNLPDRDKLRAAKWRQTLATIDWLTTQIPHDSTFQIYTFNTAAQPVTENTGGQWLDASDREVVEAAVRSMNDIVPAGGTSLYHALATVPQFNPRPDNIILLTDGLPTVGKNPTRTTTVSARQREKLFNRAIDILPSGIPVNVILYPMEGDPVAASAFWKLAVRTRGSFMSLAEDWP